MPLPADGAHVTAITYPSIEYDRPAKRVKGRLLKREVKSLNYVQCLVDGEHVDPETVEEVSEDEGEEALVEKDVQVHRGGKTFTQKRKVRAGDDGPDMTDVPKGMQDKVLSAAASVLLKAKKLAVKLTPAAHAVGAALGVVFDTAEDLKKFAYNPTMTSGVDHANNDFVKQSMQDAFGIGVSGHMVATIAAHVLTKVIAYAKRKTSATEEADTGVQEFAGFLEELYKTIMAELGVDGELPKADDIAARLQELLHGGAG